MTVGDALIRKERLNKVFTNLQKLELYLKNNPDIENGLYKNAKLDNDISIIQSLSEARIRYYDDINNLNYRINKSQLSDEEDK